MCFKSANICVYIDVYFKSAAVRNEPFFEQPGAVQRSQAPRQSMQESGRQTRSTAPGGQQQFAPAINVTPGKVVEGKIENHPSFFSFHPSFFSSSSFILSSSFFLFSFLQVSFLSGFYPLFLLFSSFFLFLFLLAIG